MLVTGMSSKRAPAALGALAGAAADGLAAACWPARSPDLIEPWTPLPLPAHKSRGLVTEQLDWGR